MSHLRIAILLFAVVPLGYASEPACRYPEEARALVTDWTGNLAAGYRAKLQSARFYAEHLLPESLSLARTVKSGGASVVESDSELI